MYVSLMACTCGRRMNEELRELRGADRGMGLEPRVSGGEGVERKDQEEGEEG
jgi:hypothetical protein